MTYTPPNIVDVQKATNWIVGMDTGLSSKTIWSVMMGVTPVFASAPADPADLGRCIRLLDILPAWRERLPEVSAKYPEWAALVENWAELEEMYRAECVGPVWRAPKLYRRMQELRGR